MKIAMVVGARPHFIKAAVVSLAFRQHRPEVDEVLVHTGQHYDAYMSDVFFEELEIPSPHYHLGVGGGTHGQNTGRMIEKIEGVLLDEKPDHVLVYGDTDSTLAGVLAAVKLHIPVAHVEAGLRSFNRHMPEEINRILTDHASDLLFAPTETAVKNLAAEGIAGDMVQNVGDVMYDAALYYSEKARKQSHILDTLRLIPKGYILVTIHRPENTDDSDRMRNILEGFAAAPMQIVWPIHPRSRKRLKDYGFRLTGMIKVIDPVGYLDMVMLEKHAALIATDSGGVQKEAYFQQVPCITLRDETEWVELIACGANRLVGAQPGLISAVLNNIKDFKIAKADLYGNGRSSVFIVRSLVCR